MQNLLSSNLPSENVKIKVYKTIILRVLYGCATRSPRFREKSRLKVLENRVLRRTFGPERDDYLGDKIKKNEMRMRLALAGDGIVVYRSLVGTTEEKRTLGQSRSRWKDFY